MTKQLNDLCSAAAQAGDILRHNYGATLEITDKSGGKGTTDFVTRVDQDAERAIRAALSSYNVVGEEEGGLTSSNYVLVDPLDGTTNFLLGVPHFAVCLSLIRDGKVTAGVVYEPLGDKMYAADLTGATLNGARINIKEDTATRRNSFLLTEENIAKTAPIKRMSRVSGSFGNTVRKFGSTALDLARMAAGQQCALVATGLKPWDYLGAAYIYERAGGRVSTLNGQELGIDSTTLLACAPNLHAGLVEDLKSPFERIAEAMSVSGIGRNIYATDAKRRSKLTLR